MMRRKGGKPAPQSPRKQRMQQPLHREDWPWWGMLLSMHVYLGLQVRHTCIQQKACRSACMAGSGQCFRDVRLAGPAFFGKAGNRCIAKYCQAGIAAPSILNSATESATWRARGPCSESRV